MTFHSCAKLRLRCIICFGEAGGSCRKSGALHQRIRLPRYRLSYSLTGFPIPSQARSKMTRGSTPDAVVVGAGIIGATVALELARRGARVTVLERGRVGQEASGVAAGMLAPQAEADRPSPFLDFALACRAGYDDWVSGVVAESGMPVDFSRQALLYVALTAENAGKLRAQHNWQASLGLPVEWMSGEEARRLEPTLAPGLAGALQFPDAARVESSGLTRAVAAAARKRGAEIIEGMEVTSLLIEGGRVLGVAAGDRRFAADWVVVAAGAWASRIAGMPMADDWIQPCRGQILAVRLENQRIGRILYTHGAYAVPCSPGLFLIGTTSEHAGFDRRVTLGGVRSIIAGVTRFAPAFDDAEVLELRAGLRPESRDGFPLLGPLTRLPGLVLATGHFRNGILLAPLTGELVAESIVSGRVPSALAPFLPDRVEETSRSS